MQSTETGGADSPQHSATHGLRVSGRSAAQAPSREAPPAESFSIARPLGKSRLAALLGIYGPPRHAHLRRPSSPLVVWLDELGPIYPTPYLKR